MDEEDWDTEITTSTRSAALPGSGYQSSSSSSAKPASGFSFGRGRVNNYNTGSGGGGGFTRPRSPNRDTSSYSDNPYANKSPKKDFSARPEQQYDSNNNNRYSSGSATDTVSVETRQISSLIGKSGATINNIRDKCDVKINVPGREELQGQTYAEVKIIGASKENVQKAKDMIREATQGSSYGGYGAGGYGGGGYGGGGRSEPVKRNYPDDSYNKPSSSFGESSGWSSSYQNSSSSYKNPLENSDSSSVTKPSGGIDWDLIRSQPSQNMSKFKDHPPVVKDFYVEDPEITAMTRDEVKQFRKENFNIMVELFKKEKLSYSLSAKVEEDTRTPEQIEDYLFERIPKPVKTIMQAFSRFPGIIDECNRQNFLKPTPIQAQLWPILLKGVDCVGIAQTGTGKTLAFLLPALVHIDNQITPRSKRVGPNVLVLSPTRELAIQIEQEVKKINYKGIKSVCVYGGGDRKEQADICTRGVEIIIATPGRLYDLIQAGVVNVTSVTYLVLDEADRMLDLGFEPQIMKILLDIRPDRQTVMTSATWPEGVRRLATKYLSEPIQLYVGSLDLRAAKTVRQLLEMTQSDDEKRARLMQLIQHEMTERDKVIVFVGRKSLADNLSCDLALKNIQCQSIHGDREQCDREEALEEFKDGTVRILIATDVASRGIDVKDITYVVNYDFPRNIEDYVHRVGRTGRAGLTGTSITFMAREDWKHARELIEILKQGEQEVPKSLEDMADRYDAMLRKRAEEGGSGGGRRGGFGGGGFGGGGFGGGGFRGGNRGFGDDRGERSGAFRDKNESSGSRSFMLRGRRGGRGGRSDDSFGFVF